MLKLSDETCRVPEQDVFDVLVVMVVVSISLEKVTVMLVMIAMEGALPAGEVEETVGAVVSIINDLFAPREPDELGEGRVNVASLFKPSLIVPLFNENEFEDL